ncbi:MAG: F0F1-type ATP synthase delta subunit [Candidatus Omnitrophota bacterium]|jgi:F0F1-type ATP synthase delta subunit
MPIIGFIIAQVVLMIIIIVILKRMIFSDTDSAINRLTKLNNQNRDKEQLLAQKLDAAEKYIAEQKEALVETDKKLKQEAKRAANQMHEDVIKKSKTESEDIIKKAHEVKDQLIIDAKIEAEGKMVEICTEIMKNVLNDAVQTEINNKLLEEFLVELEKADWSRININSDTIELASSKPIAEAYLTKVQAVLSTKLNQSIKVKSKEDPALIGGVLMKLGSTVVDGSLVERINEESKSIMEKLKWKYAS